jgi:sugar phosphate isomerase/epimerase
MNGSNLFPAGTAMGGCIAAGESSIRPRFARTAPQVLAGTVVGLLTGMIMATAAELAVSPPDNRIPGVLAAMLPQPGDESGFRPLFGSTASEGWAQCGPGFFTLTNGVATSQGGMGLWWHTNRMFTNFVIRGEWRFERRESDTGVFVRFPHPGQDPWNAVKLGHELELGDDPEGKDPTWKTGTLYPFQPPTHVPTKPVGEWNTYELAAIGHTYIVRINGETVTVWSDPMRRSAAGYVGLQNYQEGKRTQHRSFRIKELLSPDGAGETRSAAVVVAPLESAVIPPPFFAFQNGFRTSPAELAATLRALGYDGVSAEGYDLRPLLQELKARDLKLFNTYLTLEFDAVTNGLTNPLRMLIDDLQGAGAALWIAIPKVTRDGQALPNSSPEGDSIAVARLAEIADYAEPRGVKIALYPHTWFWLERVGDAVRLADKLNRPSVGSTFNLCHWLKVEGDADPAAVLKAAMPRLVFVSINGADGGDTRGMDWDRLIQSLDRGTYGVGGFVRKLLALGYRGPVGLQGYNVKGDPKDNLARSIGAWKRFTQSDNHGAATTGPSGDK